MHCLAQKFARLENAPCGVFILGRGVGYLLAVLLERKSTAVAWSKQAERRDRAAGRERERRARSIRDTYSDYVSPPEMNRRLSMVF